MSLGPEDALSIKKTEKQSSTSILNLVASNITIERILTISTFAGLLIVWQVITSLNIVSDVIIPSPGKVYNTFNDILKRLQDNSLYGTGRQYVRLIGSSVFVVTAIPIGLLSGYNSKVRAVLDHFLNSTGHCTFKDIIHACIMDGIRILQK